MSMATLLERLSRTSRDKKQNAQDRFLQLVRKAAQGEEFDIEEAADILEAANRTHEQLEDAVEVQTERIGLASQLRHKKTLESQMPKHEQTERLAGEHYERVVSEASSRLNEAKRAKRALESELLSLSYVEGKLSETCIDETLLQRESELTSKRMALVQQRRPLSDDFDRARNLVRSHQSSVDALNRKIADRNNDPVAKASYKKDLARAQQTLEHTVSVEQQLERAVAEIDEQLQPLDRELASIRLKKLEV
jgi:hypothetical protein